MLIDRNLLLVTGKTDVEIRRRRVRQGQSRRDRKRQQEKNTLLKLKGPRTEWVGDTDSQGIARFVFDTGTYSSLGFELVDKKGFMCFGRERIRGTHRYPFRQVRHVYLRACWEQVLFLAAFVCLCACLSAQNLEHY